MTSEERLNGRIPVMSDAWCIELAGPERRRALLRSRNVREVRSARGELLRLVVIAQGDDEKQPERLGNPRRYSHDHETDQNPPRCWTLRRLSNTESLYRQVQIDCIVANHLATVPPAAR